MQVKLVDVGSDLVKQEMRRSRSSPSAGTFARIFLPLWPLVLLVDVGAAAVDVDDVDVDADADVERDSRREILEARLEGCSRSSLNRRPRTKALVAAPDEVVLE